MLAMPLRAAAKDTEATLGHTILYEDSSGAATVRFKRRGTGQYAIEISSYQRSEIDRQLLDDWTARVDDTVATLATEAAASDSLSLSSVDVLALAERCVAAAERSLDPRLAVEAPGVADTWILLPTGPAFIAFDIRSSWAENGEWIGSVLGRVGGTSPRADIRIVFIGDQVATPSALLALLETSPQRFGSASRSSLTFEADVIEVLNRLLIESDSSAKVPFESHAAPNGGSPRANEAVEEMAARVRANPRDEHAWSALHSLTYRTLFRLALARVGNQEDAGDVVQETWMKFAAKPDRYQPDRPFMPWIYRVLNNTAKDFWRRTGREPEFFGLESAFTLPERGDPLDAALDREQLRDLLVDVSPEVRHALVDHYVGGLSFREIAETLDVSESTLRSRLNTALVQLGERGRSA